MSVVAQHLSPDILEGCDTGKDAVPRAITSRPLESGPASTIDARRAVGRLTSWVFRRFRGAAGVARSSESAAWPHLYARLASAEHAGEVRAAVLQAARRIAGAAPVTLIDAAERRPRAAIVVPLRFLRQTAAYLCVEDGWLSKAAAERARAKLQGLSAPAAAALLALKAVGPGKAPDNLTQGERRRGPETLNLPHPERVDPVTGLPEADYLSTVVAQALLGPRPTPFVLLLIEPEGLSRVRLTLGSVYADAALRLVAHAVTGTLRARDPVVRFDGDRFAAMLPGATGRDVPRIVAAVQRAIDEAGLTASTPRPLTARIGAAAMPDDGFETMALLRAARRNLAGA